MILINQVLQYESDSRRLRVIEIEESYIYTVNIDTTSAMPQRELYLNLQTEIGQGEIFAISDPYVTNYNRTICWIRRAFMDWSDDGFR